MTVIGKPDTTLPSVARRVTTSELSETARPAMISSPEASTFTAFGTVPAK